MGGSGQLIGGEWTANRGGVDSKQKNFPAIHAGLRGAIFPYSINSIYSINTAQHITCICDVPCYNISRVTSLLPVSYISL